MVDLVENQPLLELPDPNSSPLLTDEHLTRQHPRWVIALERCLKSGRIFSASQAAEWFRRPLLTDKIQIHDFNKNGFHYRVSRWRVGQPPHLAYGLKRVYVGDKPVDPAQELWQEEIAFIPQTEGTTNCIPQLPGWGLEYVFSKAEIETETGDYVLSSTAYTNRTIAEIRLLVIYSDLASNPPVKITRSLTQKAA